MIKDFFKETVRAKYYIKHEKYNPRSVDIKNYLGSTSKLLFSSRRELTSNRDM